MRGLFKDRLFNKHYSKLLSDKKNKTQSSFVNTISSITLLAKAKDHTYLELERAPKYFRDLGMSCDLYIIVDKNDEIKSIPGMKTIDRQECMWYEVPSQEIIIKWLSNKTDLLIVSNPQGLLMKYLCAASNSKLKASTPGKGFRPEDLDIDFWVEPKASDDVTLSAQCRLTYEMLAKLGIRPPVIG